MGKGDPITSPYLAYNALDNEGDGISVSVVFDDVTRAITAINTHRDAGCQWTNIAVGLGPDGTPNSSPMQWPVPTGDYTTTAGDLAYLASVGVSTFEQFMSYQITAV